ncbi:discoidin domain-containing protein [Cohnella sp. WQ 127256]|uniref:discoidin domain-containing protein n=1 Tax=Cohnella sp. WQ 127256 TaxID=2938790 RepID=UPI002118C43A|nr:discoidin domain-containing protein [Cohnella sp. WQ 127256]
MRRRGRSRLFITAAILFISMGLSSTQAAVPNPIVDPFPIGIFWSPSVQDTTFDKYKEIKDMNATYVLLTNNILSQAQNDAALVQCAANGLKCVIQEERLGSYKFNDLQNAGDGGGYLNYGHSFGQTFITPNTPDLAIDTIQLFMDQNLPANGEKITLRIYDSPSKTTLFGSASITGPTGTINPTFYLYKWLNPNTTYYMELTSDGPLAQSYVKYNTSDVYSGGTAFEDGVAKSDRDLWFVLNYARSMFNGGSEPHTADIVAFANHYKSNTAFLGYHLIDEPTAAQMTGIQSTIERIRAVDPDHLTYVNLLPNYAGNLGFGGQTGVFVNPTHSAGQTFKTNSKTTSISTIQLYIDKNQWGVNEPLTLKLWNSPAKTVLLAQQTQSGASTNYPQFTLNATVSPNTVYYWELTHDGGGDNSVGWVVKSTDGTEWEKDGSAYVAGSPEVGDFWFTINQNLTAFSYEDYVYRWASKNPDFMMYDHYPYSMASGVGAAYYPNLEIIRRQSLAASIDFWTYIQSVGINGALRAPTEGEIRYQVYTSLTYGAKGINYFTYVTPSGQGDSFHDGIILPDGTKNASYTHVKNINAEVLKLGPKLLSLTSQAVYHTGTLPANTTALPSSFFLQPSNTTDPLVIGYSTDTNGQKYVMVTNRDITNSRTVSFVLPSKPSAVTEVSKTTGAEVSTNYNSITGTLSSSFAPGEGRLYVLPLAPENLALNAAVTVSSEYLDWPKALLTDGNRMSIFSTQTGIMSNHSEWIEVNMGTPKTFNKVVLASRTEPYGYPKDFKIQVWDGVNWQDRVIRTNESQPSSGAVLSYTWGYSDTTSKIRILASGLHTDDNGHYLLQLGEVEVYNEP